MDFAKGDAIIATAEKASTNIFLMFFMQFQLVDEKGHMF